MDHRILTLEERVQELINRPCKMAELPRLNPAGQAGVRAVALEGIPYREKTTCLFAYYGRPERIPAGQKCPGIVLLHGGGGHAFSDWVQMWTARGYAAIAVDTCGAFPLNHQAGPLEKTELWTKKLPPELSGELFVSGPANDEMAHAGQPLEEQWIYHGLCAAVCAYNALAADQEVDPERIGVHGISWGGVIASLMIGVDLRPAFCIPVYGNGYLDRGLGIVDRMFQTPKTEEIWLAERRFSRVKCPVLWIGGDEDSCFSMLPKCQSYLDTAAHQPGTRLVLLHKMLHSHNHGWQPDEIERFANSVVRGGPSMPRISCTVDHSRLYGSVELSAAAEHEQIVRVRLLYLTEEMRYEELDKDGTGQCCLSLVPDWKSLECHAIGGRFCIPIPENVQGFYVQAVTSWQGRAYTVTSPWLQRQPESGSFITPRGTEEDSRRHSHRLA